MKSLLMPESYNYIAVFLTFRCNLSCSFCINNFELQPKCSKWNHLSASEWAVGLNRIISKPDLPITFQGGEPTLHKGFADIVKNIKTELSIDVLTNLRDEKVFLDNINPQRLRREAPYASIRVSYHPEQMDLDSLMKKVLCLQNAGFSIGIWGVMHPEQKSEIKRAQRFCRKVGIDFRTKEFLGEYDGKVYGEYRYPEAIKKEKRKTVLCKTTELIIGPNGDVFRCTADIYCRRNSIGNILDPQFQIKDEFRRCDWFGHCNPCDVKIKTDRFQQYGHSSVEIK
ncbi:MAG: radical SAM protein [Candidatus Paceibacterota bacterium]